jgi:hypothetical protein
MTEPESLLAVRCSPTVALAGQRRLAAIVAEFAIVVCHTLVKTMTSLLAFLRA